MKLVIFIILCTISGLSLADNANIASKVLANSESGPDIRELNWLNQNFLDKQRQSINNLTATHFGQRLVGSKKDLKVLQRVVDEELVPADETLQLQALGVVLGDIFVNENKNLVWKIYEDELGPTQAVCLTDAAQCLFPITMLSRRMEVGLKPNVEKIYQTNLDELRPYLPKTPYSTTQ